VSTAHEEGGDRQYAISTERFSGTEDGRVARLHAIQVETKTPVDFDADLVLLAMGFIGPERNGVIDGLGVALTPRGTVARDAAWMTSVDGVFATGDMQRGQSLIVWAIADGRSCARGVDTYLMGSSSLPAPVA
jgi:glutamate synthase (NADPH/NADH) small chain